MKCSVDQMFIWLVFTQPIIIANQLKNRMLKTLLFQYTVKCLYHRQTSKHIPTKVHFVLAYIVWGGTVRS